MGRREGRLARHLVRFRRRMPVKRAPLRLVLAAALFASATQGLKGQPIPPLDVPFVKQSKNLCGPACIAMVLQYWGQPGNGEAAGVPERISIQEIAKALDIRSGLGTRGSQMQRYFSTLDYQSFSFQGEWDDVANHLAKGRPLIVALGGRGILGHYVVLVGWNSEERVVLVNDPARRKLLKLDQRSFEKSWEQTSRWTLLALPRNNSVNASTAPDT
jgi:ABC-type bacteriocin/lantibiotic exporter with double-glycine peptidase domain